MTVQPMEPDDAPGMLAIAKEWGEDGWTITSGAAGVVVRDETTVVGFALLRELAYGFAVDEIWCRKNATGFKALALLADWVERKVIEIATERGCPITLGGIVRLDNTTHKKALERRGYNVVAEVLAKTIAPQVPANV